MDFDERWMRRALDLAQRGRGWVHPNPLVGAVVVRGEHVVGEGFHRAFGLPHAEVNALQAAGDRTRGATLYINLEPCSHWGKTPPCDEALIRAGVKKVVVAMKDPNPRVAGRGFAFLRRHGVEVVTGVLEAEARELNRAFLAWIEHQRPYVILKAATSLDGRASTVTGESKWITGPQARQFGHQLRTHVDAIAVGIETVLKDNPSLTAHGKGSNPVRMVFDSRLRTPLRARVVDRHATTWIFTTPGAALARRKQFERQGVLVHLVGTSRRGPVDVKRALHDMASGGIGTLLIEGGPTLAHSFLAAGAVDEVIWFIAPMVIGRQPKLSRVGQLTGVRVEPIGTDWVVKGRYVHRSH